MSKNFYVQGAHSRAHKLFGTRKDDDLSGGSGNDRIFGRRGDDVIDAGGGDDRVRGGRGDDTVVYVAAENQDGYDRFDGGPGMDTLLLELTGEEWRRPEVQSDIRSFLQFIVDNTNPFGQVNGRKFQFDAFGLEVRHFENLKVVVDGIELDPADEPAVAIDDEVTTLAEDAAVSGSVLDNDHILDLVAALELVEGPARGALQFNNDGTFTFDPGDAFDELGVGETAVESFTYRVTDVDGDTDVATVQIIVTGTNDGPVAVADQTATDKNQQLLILASDLLANDIDADANDVLTIQSVSNPVNGSVFLNADGNVVFTPTPGFAGEATFDYSILDGSGVQSTATVSVTVNDVPDLPTPGDDVLIGTADNDTIDALAGNDQVFGLAGQDTLFGGTGNDFIDGGDGDDFIDLGDGNDIAVGGAGNDFITGGAQAGSNDLNTASYSGATAAISAVLSGPLGAVTGDDSVGTDTLGVVDRIFGSDFDDVFTVDGSWSGSQFTGGAYNEIQGGGGDDLIIGNGITRLGYLDAGPGGVTVDFINGIATGDGVGTDTFSGASQLRGSDYGDTVIGSANDEQFRMRGGDDVIDGGGGIDQARYSSATGDVIADLGPDNQTTAAVIQDGFGGNDTLIGIENIRSGNGDDQLFGDVHRNILQAGGGDDILDGRGGHDTLLGEGGNDHLSGGDGSDFLNGQDGDDVLIGGNHSDQLLGGAGSDVFIFRSSEESSVGQFIRDVIWDFEAGTGNTAVDRLDISGLATGVFDFLGAETETFSGSGNTEARFNNQTKILEIDADGDTQADMEIELQNVDIANLDNDDFVTS